MKRARPKQHIRHSKKGKRFVVNVGVKKKKAFFGSGIRVAPGSMVKTGGTHQVRPTSGRGFIYKEQSKEYHDKLAKQLEKSYEKDSLMTMERDFRLGQAAKNFDERNKLLQELGGAGTLEHDLRGLKSVKDLPFPYTQLNRDERLKVTALVDLNNNPLQNTRYNEIAQDLQVKAVAKDIMDRLSLSDSRKEIKKILEKK